MAKTRCECEDIRGHNPYVVPDPHMMMPRRPFKDAPQRAKQFTKDAVNLGCKSEHTHICNQRKNRMKNDGFCSIPDQCAIDKIAWLMDEKHIFEGQATEAKAEWDRLKAKHPEPKTATDAVDQFITKWNKVHVSMIHFGGKSVEHVKKAVHEELARIKSLSAAWSLTNTANLAIRIHDLRSKMWPVQMVCSSLAGVKENDVSKQFEEGPLHRCLPNNTHGLPPNLPNPAVKTRVFSFEFIKEDLDIPNSIPVQCPFPFGLQHLPANRTSFFH
jgi:hypothetical protein